MARRKTAEPENWSQLAAEMIRDDEAFPAAVRKKAGSDARARTVLGDIEKRAVAFAGKLPSGLSSRMKRTMLARGLGRLKAHALK